MERERILNGIRLKHWEWIKKIYTNISVSMSDEKDKNHVV